MLAHGGRLPAGQQCRPAPDRYPHLPTGRTYVMESDLEAPPTFVPPANRAGKSVPVSRVLVVRRAARSEGEICGAEAASKAEDKPESPQKEHKRARKEEKSHKKGKKEKKEKKEKRSKDRN